MKFETEHARDALHASNLHAWEVLQAGSLNAKNASYVSAGDQHRLSPQVQTPCEACSCQ